MVELHIGLLTDTCMLISLQVWVVILHELVTRICID
jgi:hypothetical protein